MTTVHEPQAGPAFLGNPQNGTPLHSLPLEKGSPGLARAQGAEETGAAPAELELERVQVPVLDRWITVVLPKDWRAVMRAYKDHFGMDLDKYGTTVHYDRQPYWCRPWSSGICLAEEVLSWPEVVAGKEVCELGSGLGVAGLCASLSGANQVVLFDREPPGLRCALMTAAANGVPVGPLGHFAPTLSVLHPFPSSAQSKEKHTSSRQASKGDSKPSTALRLAPAGAYTPRSYKGVPHYLFDGAVSASAAKPEKDLTGKGQVFPQGQAKLRAEHFDWDEDCDKGTYDTVLASDVLFEMCEIEKVAKAMMRLLRRGKDSRVVVADPRRYAKNRAHFIKVMSEMHQMTLERTAERQTIVDGAIFDIDVLHFVRSSTIASHNGAGA